jgi:hypothetical protein
MDLLNLILEIKHLLKRDLKFSRLEFRQLHELRKDVIELEQITVHSGAGFSHYQKHAKKLEKSSEQIAKKLTVWLEKLEKLLSQEKQIVQQKDQSIIAQFKSHLEIPRDNLMELHQLLSAEFPDWAKAELLINDIIGNETKPGIRGLINLFEQLDKYENLLRDKLEGIKWDYSAFENLFSQIQAVIAKGDEVSEEIRIRLERRYFNLAYIKEINPHSPDIAERYGLKMNSLALLNYLADRKEFPHCAINKIRTKKILIDDIKKTTANYSYIEILDVFIKYLFRLEKDKTKMMLPLVLFIEHYINSNKHLPEIIYAAIEDYGLDENKFLNRYSNLIKDVLAGKSALEIGGEAVKNKLSQYGLHVSEPKITQYGFTSVAEEGRVNLDSYDKLIGTKQADFGYSRELFSQGSGIEYGGHEMDWCCQELMTVYANLTKKGGLNIHIGDSIPGTDFLNILGFKEIHKWNISSDWGFTFHFLIKINDKITSKEEFLKIAGNK